MRIKKITPTDRYKHIDFEHIKNHPDYASCQVLTPSGWTVIKAFGFMKRAKSKIIKTNNFELHCDYKHILQTSDGKSVFACDLDPSKHHLLTFNNQPIEFDISDGQEEDFYDIEIASPHWWYTSGIVSHNSILLCNNAISSLKGMGPGGVPGQDVLLITCEMDTIKTAMRCLGVMAQDIPMNQIPERKEYISRIVNQVHNTYNKRFLIVEWPPEECSVNHIYALLDSLKRTDGWHPDVIILDYLDLLVSRNAANNTDGYSRQKSVSNEIRGLAINENVLVFTATQTNRTAVSGEDVADMGKAAESFGKQFSLDYVVSLNQTRNERSATPPRMRMYIAKNRNGPKNEIIDCTITYETMVVREQP
jgi:hypothetical protein